MTGVAALIGWLAIAVRTFSVAVCAFALVIWLVELAARSGTISPYGSFARTMRRIGDPFTRRVERWLLKQGGVPSAAAGWGVVIAIIGSLLLIWAVDFLGQMMASLVAVSNGGPSSLLRFVAEIAFQVLFVALLIRVIGSWVGLSPYSRIGRTVGVLTDWLLDPLRRMIPPIGGSIDITPMIAYFLLQIARGALLRALL